MATRRKPGKPRGRKPDFTFKIYNVEEETGAVVGAGWENEDGSINLKLNECVVLEARDTHLVLKLFPNTYEFDAMVPKPESISHYESDADRQENKEGGQK